jgi:hypothetical protein
MEIEQYETDIQVVTQVIERFAQGCNAENGGVQLALLEYRMEPGAKQRMVIHN